MKIVPEHLTEISEENDIYSVLGKPEDPSSDWTELRCAQLSGYDYIFLSSSINSKLTNKTSLSEFLIDVYQHMDTTHERAKFFIYTQNNVDAEFSSFEIRWKGANVKDFHINTIKNLEQKEFIRTIFDHSGMMVGSA